jgi:hypothetical protein
MWWRRLVGYEMAEVLLRRDQDEGKDAWARAQATFERKGRIFDPPEFESLGNMLALRSALATTYSDAIRSNSFDRNGIRKPEQRELFGWPIVSSVAESVCADRNVAPDHLDAAVFVLDVRGLWSHLAGPGRALCSAAVSAHPPTAHALMYDAFSSGLK